MKFDLVFSNTDLWLLLFYSVLMVGGLIFYSAT